MKEIKPGIYMKAKGGLYRVLCVARHSENQEELVIYQAATDEKKTWACPIALWNEEVDVGGERRPRFAYLACDMDAVDGMRAFAVIEEIKEHMETYIHTGEDDWLAFYDKPTNRIMNVRRSVIGALEEGEEPQEYEEREKTDAEWILEHWDQCLRLPDEFDEYQEMENFIDALPTPYQEPLERAICGKGAFRRFRETAARLKVLDHWYAYREAAYRREAREWCDANGIAWWERAWEDRA